MSESNITVVTASDMNYLWGVFLLIASMRAGGMAEKALVLGSGYTEKAKALLHQFGEVEIHDAEPSKRSMTCQKPDALLLARTDYAVWADCDGFFAGNCSKYLVDPAPEKLHLRRRSVAEMCRTFARFYAPGETPGGIPAEFRRIWQRDVGERQEAAATVCCSACFLGLHRRNRAFLERWRDQMHRVLPDDDVGVVDSRSTAYFQTDEAVLNSLLCYLFDAPPLSDDFRLDKDENGTYIHFVCHPKPWNGWTPYAFPAYDRYLAVVEYLLEGGYELPGPLPFSLTPGNKKACRILMRPIQLLDKVRHLRKRLRAAWPVGKGVAAGRNEEKRNGSGGITS